MQTCASCNNFNINNVVKSDKSLDPTWLQNVNYVEKFIDSMKKFTISHPSNYDTIVKVNVGKTLADRKLLYWASNKKKSYTPLIVDAKKAYNKFENHGIAQVNEYGDVIFKIECPQIYSVIPKGKHTSDTFFRHMHFVASDKKQTRWLPQIYTKIVKCQYNFEETMKHLQNQTSVFINALPHEYYAKDHIPNSYNLPLNFIKSLSPEDLKIWFTDVIKIHYPKLKKYLQNDKIRLYEIPIIVYCAHSKCNASELVSNELMKNGFVNVSEYNGGMLEFRNLIKPNTKLF